jgi:hypothetical protein
MDILDIFKTFAEEPDKVSKRIINTAKLSINLIFASYLFEKVIGPYTLINFSEVQQWVNYALSGRLLLSLFFLVVSHLLLFNLGHAMVFWPLQRIFDAKIQFNKPVAEAGALIRYGLRLLKVVQYDQQSNKWMAGENIDDFSEFIQAFSSNGEESLVGELKHSILNDVWKLCFGFNIVYFIFLPFYKQTFLFDFILIFLLFAIPYFYVILSKLYLLGIKHKEKILQDVEALKTVRVIFETFKNAGSPITHCVDSIEGGSDDQIIFGGVKYILKMHFAIFPLHDSLLKSYKEEGERKKLPLIILSDQDISEEATKIMEDCTGAIIIVKWEKGIDLRGEIWTRINEARKYRA